jgi:RHS repeat-associated protein
LNDNLQSSTLILDEGMVLLCNSLMEFSQSENSRLNSVSCSYSRTDYTAFGEVRAETGTSPTDYQYTGQRSYLDSFGLHYYVARWYDPVTAHFAQADTIIPQPGNSADWNRYAYVNYNPIKYNDPTGHCLLLTMGVGALIGGAVGAITYVATNGGDSFDKKEFATAVGVGMLAGGLIGSGLGLLAAPAATAGITIAGATAVQGATVAAAGTAMVAAGTGMTMAGGSYMVTNVSEFDSHDFAVTTSIAGMVSGINSIQGPTALGYTIIGTTNILGSQLEYAATTDNWTNQGATAALGAGMIGAGFDMYSSASFRADWGNYNPFEAALNKPNPKPITEIIEVGADIRFGQVVVESFYNLGGGFASSVSTAGAHWLGRVME